MDPLDLIRTTHEIDRHVAELAAAVTDENLKKDLLTCHARWRELGYRITADLCGVAPNGGTAAPKRRGRRKLVTAGSADEHATDPGAQP